MNLTNKAALITGSSRGLGRALAARLARQGARVVLVARDLGADPVHPIALTKAASTRGAVMYPRPMRRGRADREGPQNG